MDTVCSSSLVSTHLAMAALVAGDCSAALSAAVNLLLTPNTTAMCQRAGMLAADGRCKTLDSTADGYVRAEAAGAMLIASWDVDQKDGGSKVAELLLLGTAVNQDGRSSSLTAPNGPAQQVSNSTSTIFYVEVVSMSKRHHLF